MSRTIRKPSAPGTVATGLSAALLLAAAGAPGARAAADVNPSISLGTEYSDNVGYASANDQADWAATLGFRVPIVWRRTRGTTALSFNGTYVKQDKEESLDRFNWGAAFAVSQTPARARRSPSSPGSSTPRPRATRATSTTPRSS